MFSEISRSVRTSFSSTIRCFSTSGSMCTSFTMIRAPWCELMGKSASLHLMWWYAPFLRLADLNLCCERLNLLSCLLTTKVIFRLSVMHFYVDIQLWCGSHSMDHRFFIWKHNAETDPVVLQSYVLLRCGLSCLVLICYVKSNWTCSLPYFLSVF